MSSYQKTNWFWSDWLGDLAVRRLTPAERGLWIDLLALASAGTPTGFVTDPHGQPLGLDEIARVTNEKPKNVSKLIDGLLQKGAASRDADGRIFNRRMVRDGQKDQRLSEMRAAVGREGGLAKWRNERQRKEGLANSKMPSNCHEQNPSPKDARAGNPYLKSKITTSFSEAAREEQQTTAPSPALPSGRPKEASGPAWRTRAELEEMFNRKKGSG